VIYDSVEQEIRVLTTFALRQAQGRNPLNAEDAEGKRTEDAERI
jgi:hypothetical protein